MGTPPASLGARSEKPRADSVRIVEHAPVCQLAVESFKNPVSKVTREAISKPNSEVRYAKFEGQAIIHETSASHVALIPTGIHCYGHFTGPGAHASDFRQMRGTPGSRARPHGLRFTFNMSLALADKTGCDKTGFDLLARFLACFVGGLEGLG